MDAGFVWLMFGMKIPIVMLLWLVWWAIRATPDPEPTAEDEGGGSDRIPHRHRRPQRPWPRAPRPRGPHGGTAVAPPRRVRRVAARGRDGAAR